MALIPCQELQFCARIVQRDLSSMIELLKNNERSRIEKNEEERERMNLNFIIQSVNESCYYMRLIISIYIQAFSRSLL